MTDALKALDVPRSTYYRWRAKYRKYVKLGLKDKPSVPRHQWNEFLADERLVIDKISYVNPGWSSREISHFITDKKGFSVSEITVFRHLKTKGLIRSREVTSFPAGTEYSYKPSRVNEQWQKDG